MGIFDNFLNIMRLNPDDDEDFFNEDFEDDYEVEKPAKPSVKAKKEKEKEKEVDSFEEYKEKPFKISPKVTPIRPAKRQSTAVGNNMEVCVIKPTSMEDAREITETLLDNRAVVLNVEGLDVAIAQRIIDFTSGSTFAIDGNLQKISNYIFIITPPSVEVSGDFLSFVDSFDSKGF